ncbi:hypothetical protein EYR40_000236 [Pleurotus pulmonarius]|nr:hypothetical protein EYR36_001401 [Pleurotus pulmonarius]KAF4607900.1 hypothetical protein EYR40_000236 [Pleurotus pulmonarius]
MMPTFPFEIWAHIASYLSNIEVKTLLSVNRALYQISMNARYKTLRVQYPPQLMVSRLRMMQDTASVTRRVQELEISSRMLEALWRYQQHKDCFRHLIAPLNKDPATLAIDTKSTTPTQKLLLDAVNNMHGLRSVFFDLRSIVYSDVYTIEDAFVMAGLVWSLLSDRVDSLSISVWEAQTPLLHPTLSSVLGVKHLSISLTGHRQSKAEGLADLINTSSQSLESLRLEAPFGFPYHKMFAGLRRSVYSRPPMYFKPPFIDTFPALKRVDFSFYKNLRASEMARFLNSHGETIEELTLATNIDRTSNLISFLNSLLAETIPIFSISALQLPLLRSLSIAWNLFEGSLDVPFQQLWSNVDFPVLDTLKLISPSMDNAHLAFFCDAFKRSSAGHIRRLELPFTFTNAETLDHLSEAFPNLHTLILSTTWLSNPAMTNPSWDIVG